SEGSTPKRRMTMAFTPYLAFAGNCREAFTKYEEVFGGELMLLTFSDAPPDAAPTGTTKPDGIMHAQLTGNDAVLMGADDPSGGFDGVVRGMCVSVSLSDPKEARRIFDALSDGGSVQMPVTETFFSPAFGM